MKSKEHYSQLQAIPTKQTESEIQANIIQYLMDCGYMTIRVNSFAMKVKARYIRAYYVYGLGAAKGLPDVLALKDGKGFLIEVKDAKNGLSDEQIEFIDFAALHGVSVCVARSIEDVENYLTTICSELKDMQ